VVLVVWEEMEVMVELVPQVLVETERQVPQVEQELQHLVEEL
jgi:hypothetical protein